MLTKPKYYLQFENERNARNGYIFDKLIKKAFGADEVVIDGHHFMFEPQSAMDAHDLSKVNEIPSADTLLFDHDIMREVFGEGRYIQVMEKLARTPVGGRDAVLLEELTVQYPPAYPNAAPIRIAPQPATPVTSVDAERDLPLRVALQVARQQRQNVLTREPGDTERTNGVPYFSPGENFAAGDGKMDGPFGAEGY